MSNKSINIILMALLVLVSAVSIYMRNYFILVANVCVLSGVIIDQQTTERLQRENVNFKLVRRLKRLAPLLWLIGGLALIAWGYTKMLSDS